MNHSEVISTIIKSMPNVKSYLELGIYEGETFEKIWPSIEQCVGVDMIDKRKLKFKGTFHLCTTDEFFKNNLETFDAIFIDADHRFKQLKKDFIASIEILNSFGVIFIHDTDPATKELTQPGYCCDAYKIVEWIYKIYHTSLDIVTLPICKPGLSIVSKKNGRRIRCL